MLELEPHELLEEVEETLHRDIFGTFEGDLRKLLKSCEEDEDAT